MKNLKKTAIVLLVALVVAQFFGPEKNEGNLASVETFMAETNPPENVRIVLKESCFDCHSNKTNYPWYNKITPVNYWLNDHVKDGKKHFNFSNWAAYSLKKKEHKMKELFKEVKEKDMPLDSYTWIHDKANLTQEQVTEIVSWAKGVQANYQLQLNSK